MILLQSKDRFDDILLLDLEKGEQHHLKRSSAPEFANTPIGGTFAILQGCCLMLYRLGPELRFAIDNQIVVIDDTVSPFLKKENGIGLFILKRKGKEALRFKYSLADTAKQKIHRDTTAHVSDEDFDFCQFVYNVLNNPQRRNFIYIELQSSD